MSEHNVPGYEIRKVTVEPVLFIMMGVAILILSAGFSNVPGVYAIWALGKLAGAAFIALSFLALRMGNRIPAHIVIMVGLLIAIALVRLSFRYL